MCVGFLLAAGAKRRGNGGASVNRTAIPAREGGGITDGRPFWRRNRPGRAVSLVAIPTVGDFRAAEPADYRRSRIPAQPGSTQPPPAPRAQPSHEKSPGRTTGALSERYISFVDSSFSSTHSFSRMTGFLSTRPSRSAGTR